MVHLITDQGEHLKTFESIRLVDLVAVIQDKGYHVEEVKMKRNNNELLVICCKRRCGK